MRRRATYTWFPRPMRAFVPIILAPTLLLGGCIYAGGRTVREVGPRITHDSTAFIEPGKTTVDWVIAAFGEPQNRIGTLDGAELLRYDCDVRTTEGSYLFMLFASSNNRIERTSWWFETRGQKVTRFWCDTCSPTRVQELNEQARAAQARENAQDEAAVEDAGVR